MGVSSLINVHTLSLELPHHFLKRHLLEWSSCFHSGSPSTTYITPYGILNEIPLYFVCVFSHYWSYGWSDHNWLTETWVRSQTIYLVIAPYTAKVKYLWLVGVHSRKKGHKLQHWKITPQETPTEKYQNKKREEKSIYFLFFFTYDVYEPRIFLKILKLF